VCISPWLGGKRIDFVSHEEAGRTHPAMLASNPGSLNFKVTSPAYESKGYHEGGGFSILREEKSLTRNLAHLRISSILFGKGGEWDFFSCQIEAVSHNRLPMKRFFLWQKIYK
jgi:hypothetical protein